ncbi:hypothetical protein VR46_43580, partial [Streptomyces sp. NRRL S-444]
MNASTTFRRSRRRALAVAALTAAAVTGQLLVTSPLAQADADHAARSIASTTNQLEPPPDHEGRDDDGRDENGREDDGRHENGSEYGDDESKPTVKTVHGLQEFTADGTFVPPKGVTSVFTQAWGAGGGGGGGGGGGFVWCAIPVKSSKSYTVVLGDGGDHGGAGPAGSAGAPGGAGTVGAAGTATTLTST